ncbi:MAG TPA: IS4 family transposase [Thauera sp.]|nr:IS4 family transposase [Thauera sp.]
MNATVDDEWGVVQRLLPPGWESAARELGAFRRARYIAEPGALLRLLLFHAVNDSGLRETVGQARASGIASMSQVALLKRLRTSGAWLAWIGAELCRGWRDAPRVANAMRLRAVDSTTVQGPASKGIDWRVHYSLDLNSLSCDWFELTDARGGERLERTPMQSGDVLLADRNYLQPAGIAAAHCAGAYVLIRMRWTHPALQDQRGRPFRALDHARSVKTGQVKAWSVEFPTSARQTVTGRVVVMRLPTPLAAQAVRRRQRKSAKTGKTLDPRSVEAAQFVMLFTTLPQSLLADAEVAELYRFRWQVELAFKRMKQLLKLGRLPHQDAAVARTWIHAKLVVALLLETMFRNARTLSPWGYKL